MKRILVIGGAHLDRRGMIEGPAHLHASNPGRWLVQPGGGAFNAASALARLGNAVTLIAPRGGDTAGELVAAAVEEAGIEDRPVVFLDRATPTYTAILDERGDLVVALADMALYDAFRPRQCDRRQLREAIAGADFVLTDANLSADTLAALASRCREAGTPLAAIAISPAKVVRLKPALPDLACLFMNSREAAALAGADEGNGHWPERLRAEGLRSAVISSGADAVVAYDEDGVWRIRPPRVESVVDVTGAGDALAGATLSALAAGNPLESAVCDGIAAAAIAVGSADSAPASIHPQSLAKMRARLPSTPEPVAEC